MGDGVKVVGVTKDEKKGMIELIFDDDSVVSVYNEDYYGLGLYDKQEFSTEELGKLKLKTHERMGRTLALKMIFTRKRTRKEVEDRLKSKEILEDSIRVVLDRLEAEGYIDDERYANRLVNKMRANNKTRKQIEMEFVMRGLDVSRLDAIDDMGLDEVVAKNLFDKKFSGKDLNDEKTKVRVYNYLRSKGFSYDIIRKYVTF